MYDAVLSVNEIGNYICFLFVVLCALLQLSSKDGFHYGCDIFVRLLLLCDSCISGHMKSVNT
jgi:hypothetical protein